MKTMLLGAALLVAFAATAATAVNNATDSVAVKSEQATKPAKANPIDTLVVTTDPQMHCSSCENRIKQNIRFVKGTKHITTNLDDQTVTIVYDSRKATPADYTKAFDKIGYTITPAKK